MTKDKKITSQKSSILLWHYLLAVLIIILPAVGFYGGIKYQQLQNTSNTISATQTASQKASPDTLVIIRVNDKQDGLSQLIKTITDKTSVMKLYNEIYALPDAPGGQINCPRADFEEYTLDFYQSNKQILNATFNPTGCRIVSIPGEKTRSALQSNGQIFTNDLEQTLGILNKN